MKELIKLIFWVAIIFFCWGWVSNVAKGRMTTSQYIHKIDRDFQQAIIDGTNKMLKTSYVSRITRNVQTFYNGDGEPDASQRAPQN